MIFETNFIPKKWSENLLLSDYVIFPSEYNYVNYSDNKCKNYMIRSFIEYNLTPPDQNELTHNLSVFKNFKHKYYFIAQWNFRKNIQKLINIFKNIFKDNKDVCLFIKTFIGYGDESILDVNNCENPKIIIERDIYSENQINLLHDIGDYYINSSHNEGIGLGLLTASMQNIVVSIDKGGHNSYINDYIKLKSNECYLDFNDSLNNVNTIKKHYSDYTSEMKWFDYDENEMSEVLINLCNNKYHFVSNKLNIDLINENIKIDYINLFKHQDIILLQQYFIPLNEERKKEIDYTLQQNLNNIFINKIILLNEVLYDFSNFKNNYKIQQIVINERLTFQKSIDYKNMLEQRNILIICNNDIEFTDDIKLLFNLDNILFETIKN